ncbi:MAG: 3-deoxy-7-phosphoheptulonate synthase [Zoogloeaceae bacterium]|nr:3-deoxy-7-phosphoheptulonate synthase [Zoogloeaceae bacterium]
MRRELLEDIRVAAFDPMPTPNALHEKLPLTDRARQTVSEGRKVLNAILDGTDHRLFAVVGPCSIHDPQAGLEYARRLKALADELADTIYLVMRVYFEKPRTTVGWKGYINDPFMDDSFRVDVGMEKAREFLLQVADLGLPTGTEALDPTSPQYLDDLIAWNAIGARTTESQTHREMSSGLSTPVGFKNGTGGDLSVAVNAILSASRPHSFLGVDGEGRVAIVRTTGNPYGHMVLRGGDDGPNYEHAAIAQAEQALAKAKLPARVVVDCSHANSSKKPERQPRVLADLVRQIRAGNRSIIGVMIESHLQAGNQPIPADLTQLEYGKSVTDACVDWGTTETMLRDAAAQLQDLLPGRVTG